MGWALSHDGKVLVENLNLTQVSYWPGAPPCVYNAEVGLQLRPPQLSVVIPKLTRVKLALVYHSAGAKGSHVEPETHG